MCRNVDRHSLLDAKINSVLSLCHDQVILNAVHSIIQNMIACEDVSQQQLSYLQSKPAAPAEQSCCVGYGCCVRAVCSAQCCNLFSVGICFLLNVSSSRDGIRCSINRHSQPPKSVCF